MHRPSLLLLLLCVRQCCSRSVLRLDSRTHFSSSSPSSSSSSLVLYCSIATNVFGSPPCDCFRRLAFHRTRLATAFCKPYLPSMLIKVKTLTGKGEHTQVACRTHHLVHTRSRSCNQNSSADATKKWSPACLFSLLASRLVVRTLLALISEEIELDIEPTDKVSTAKWHSPGGAKFYRGGKQSPSLDA